jgi:hypothetical protein
MNIVKGSDLSLSKRQRWPDRVHSLEDYGITIFTPP